MTAPAVYTVTGSNSVDSIQTQLNIEVQAQVVPPTSLAYLDPVPVYIVGEPVNYNEPQPTGGEITQYSVTPALPAGLSLNTLTGVISGTPTTAQSAATHTVTGSNSAGSVTAQVVIDVNLAVLGEWLPADGMNQGRSRHAATLLANGQVLVAGGYNQGALSSAELYNPQSDSWSTTSSLAQARFYHTATLLPDVTGLCRAAGLGVGYSSHSGRRTFATCLIANGHSLETVQTLLGHAHIDHVALYLEVSQRELREAVAAVNLSD